MGDLLPVTAQEEPKLRHIPVEDGQSDDSAADFDEPERLLTEMPRILNPIDPMDGVIPEIDRDWLANRVEEAESLQMDPESTEDDHGAV